MKPGYPLVPHFYIDVPPSALTAESGTLTASNLWQFIGVVEDLANFKGVEVFVGDAKNADGISGVVRRVFVACNPVTPAGQVLMDFAKTVMQQVRAEEAYHADKNPNKPDLDLPDFDWLYPVRKTLQMGGKLNKLDCQTVGSAADSSPHSLRPRSAFWGQW